MNKLSGWLLLSLSLLTQPVLGQIPAHTVVDGSPELRLDAKSYAAARPLDFEVADLSYEPRKAKRFKQIQKKMAFSEQVLAVADTHGFAIADDGPKTFLFGFERLYHADLPIYVSADAIMHAVHRSYDDILVHLEMESLIPNLRVLLEKMRGAFGSADLSGVSAEARQDADLYLAVALSLLDDKPAAPVGDASAAEVARYVQLAKAAGGLKKHQLFGHERTTDFSQFKPRGHYLRHPKLESYFRAMMWLGRVDFRMIDVKPTGEREFLRRQYEGTMAISQLLRDSGGIVEWSTINDTVETFVGQSDNFGPPELPRLLQAFSVKKPVATLARSDGDIQRLLESHDLGGQRIGGSVRVVDDSVGEVSLAASFRLFGQRYIPDSEVFHQTTPEQVMGRSLPNPLDVAATVFDNAQAGQLLGADLGRYPELPNRLDRMESLMDVQTQAYWDANIYTAWLAALRTLSPTQERIDDPRMPQVTKSEAWGRRILNTQLGSWAELRHDTLLYAKQSFSAVIACEFPDVYVEPVPEFWTQLGRLADRFDSVDTSRIDRKRFERFVGTLRDVSRHFGDLSQRQLRGEPPTRDQLRFVNQMVRLNRSTGCGGTKEVQTPGWYYDLHYSPGRAEEYDPVIADVHTAPQTREVLHVATAAPNYALLTIDTCDGAAAYVGLVSSYHEVKTTGMKRLSDVDWIGLLSTKPPAPVVWMQDLVVP